MEAAMHSPSAPLNSLEEIHATVPIPATRWRRFLAFSGPALLVSVGYMDPGNWGSDIEAGSRFGYRLIWVLLMSNLMAVLLQTLATRLGVVTGRDLAQSCRESFPRPAVLLLWLLTEIAIAATDLAELIGTVIALNLLFHLSYLWGLLVAACDTFLLLALQRRGVRLLELVTLALVGVIGGSFIVEIVLARPDWAAVLRGFVPGLDTTSQKATLDSLYVAIAMIGATVMPHNLYLHSALVQSRAFPQTDEGKKVALRYNFLDSMLALNGAFFVNAFILIMAVATFYVHGQEPETLQDAHTLLRTIWGTALAPVLFAVALLASGQSSTFTGTLAGQVVMEGFMHWRLRPWLRRLITRLVAIVPALMVIGLAGQDATLAGMRLLQLLVLSQVVLSLQLPFAIVPLVQFTSHRGRMGRFASRAWLKVLAWACAAVVVGLNVFWIYNQTGDWAEAAANAGWNPWWVYGTAWPVAGGLIGFLAWLVLHLAPARGETVSRPLIPPTLPLIGYRRIGVAVELEGADEAVLAQAAALARSHQAQLLVLHVVEGPGAAYHGPAVADRESRSDRELMTTLVEHLREDGLAARGLLGYGNPPEELVRLATEEQLDLLVLGAHGHRFFADLTLGQTVSPVLHRLTIPVLVVPSRAAGRQPGA